MIPHDLIWSLFISLIYIHFIFEEIKSGAKDSSVVVEGGGSMRREHFFASRPKSFWLDNANVNTFCHFFSEKHGTLT